MYLVNLRVFTESFLKRDNREVKVIELSKQAVVDLRIALQKSHGEDFTNGLSDEEINRIGVVILSGVIESLKLEIAAPELSAKNL